MTLFPNVFIYYEKVNPQIDRLFKRDKKFNCSKYCPFSSYFLIDKKKKTICTLLMLICYNSWAMQSILASSSSFTIDAARQPTPLKENNG